MVRQRGAPGLCALQMWGCWQSTQAHTDGSEGRGDSPTTLSLTASKVSFTYLRKGVCTYTLMYECNNKLLFSEKKGTVPQDVTKEDQGTIPPCESTLPTWSLLPLAFSSTFFFSFFFLVDTSTK